MKPILSFCIPTRNRPKQLERLLIRLVSQLTPEVEVMILDDSTDNLSESVAKKYLPNARYVRGEKVGLDLATMYLLEYATGRWMWYFSDDDELEPKAIPSILGVLKQYPDIDFMWVNFFYDNRKRIAVNQGEGFFRDRNDVLETVKTNMGLMSTLILRRDAGLPYLSLGKKHSVGFAYAILIPILGALTGNGKFYLMKPLVTQSSFSITEIKEIIHKRGDDYNLFFDIYGINFYNTINLFKDGFSRKAIRTVQKVNFAGLWRGILVGWINGCDTPKGKRLRMMKYFWRFPEAWIALTLFLIPLSINKILFRLYKVFFSHRRFRFGKNKWEEL